MGVVVFWKLPFSRESQEASNPFKSRERSKNMVTFPKERIKHLKRVWWLTKYTIYILYAANPGMQICASMCTAALAPEPSIWGIWFFGPWCSNINAQLAASMFDRPAHPNTVIWNMVLGKRSFPLGWFFFYRLSGYAGFGRCIKGGLIVFANFATWLKMILTQNQCANCSEALFKNDPWWQGQLSST